uniref:Ethanolaminephosphotransferase n=1 Tax=Meloidogyne incognita TaxID=6306 RepID=A0A914NBS5_MELIC
MSTIFRTKYLNEQQLEGFNKYKYACIDNSPISVYISHPFWNWIVEFYPRWLPPNVLTLGGFLILISSFILVSIYDYNFNSNTFGFKQEEGTIPNWIWLICSIATFLAHLLDGTDGKQARRTGSSGPTGELFDHGFDSWSTVPLTLTIFSIFGRGEYSISPYTMLCVLISVQLVFICSHWEKYNTGVLFLSWGYDASQYGLCIFYLFAFFANPKIFHSNLVDGLSLAYFIATTFFISCILSLASCLYNVYHAYIISKTGVQETIGSGLKPLISPFLLFSCTLIWGAYSPNKVLEMDPRAFFWTMGVVFSNIAAHLIIAQMSSTKVAAITTLLIVYILIVLLSLFGLFASFEIWVLRGSAILFTLAHIYYGCCVINQLCDHFKIQPLSLNYLEKQK